MSSVTVDNLSKPCTGTTSGSKRALDVYVAGSSSESSSAGSTAGGGAMTYYAKPSGTNADASVAYTSATTITITGLSFTFTKYDIVSVRQIPNAGGADTQDTVFSDVTNFSVVGTVITVAGASFAATDNFVVILSGDRKYGDDVNEAGRVTIVNRKGDDMVAQTFPLTNVPNATPSITYIPMGIGYDSMAVQVVKTGGTDTFTAKYGTSLEGSGATKSYIDTTAGWTDVGGGGFTANHIAKNEGLACGGHKVTITTAGGANDADFNIFVYQWKK